MKLKYVLLAVLSYGFVVACSDEEKIVPGEDGVNARYEFPQGTDEWDDLAKTIKEDHDVYMIYKDFTQLDISRAWTAAYEKDYNGESLTGEQANAQMKFMKQHFLDYLPTELTRSVLPLYYYLISEYRTESISGTSVSKSLITNFSDGLDFWVSSICTSTETTFPDTREKLKEHRVRIMKQFLEAAINRGVIEIPSSFNKDFDYTTAIKTYSWDSDDPNYYLKRGFLGSISGDSFNLGSIYSISDVTQAKNFLTYVFSGMRYTEEEFLAKFPAEYTLIHKKRLEVINYMKEKYHVDLEAICQGPVL